MSQRSNKSRIAKPKKQVEVKTHSADSVHTINSHQSSVNISFLPDPKNFENATEIAHLKLRHDVNESPSLNDFAEVQQSCCLNFVGRLCRFISKFKNCRRREEISGDLDDLDPVAPRTRNSIEFIGKLVEPSRAHKSKSIANTGYTRGSFSSPASKPRELLTKRAYKSIYDGLSNLQQANQLYKQLILLMTFTRYAEKPPLDEYELTLTRGKTVVGCYVWMVTFALQQLQYDPDVEINGYPAIELKEIIRSMEALIAQSVFMWKALLHTIETVEQLHQKVTQVFTSVVRSLSVPQNKNKKDLVATRHIKTYKKFQHRAEELEKLKQYDAFKSAQTWTKFSFAPLRILYKDDRGSGKPGTGGATIGKNNWLGFDLLNTNIKFSALKILQLEVHHILQAVLDQLEKIDNLLHSTKPSTNKRGKDGKDISTVNSFEDGIVLMGRYLEQMQADAWTPQEVKDLFEVEKITLDNLDLLTLGTATMRTLVHEARHIIHITYETTRDLDYIECRVMNSYEEVVSHFQKDFNPGFVTAEEKLEGGGTDADSNNSLPKDIRKSRISKLTRKRKQSIYDIEEQNFDPRDAETQFERSIYQDILKELPVTTNNGVVGFTLQYVSYKNSKFY